MVSPTPTTSAVEGLDLLSSELLQELRDVESQFDVTTQKLKDISQHFEQELQKGLQGDDDANIVRYLSPSSTALLIRSSL
jgi:hexokinase